MRIAALASLLVLAACGHKPPEEAVLDEGNLTNEMVDNSAAEEAANYAVVTPENMTNTPPAVAPPPTISEQAQMRDDADATGLTARLPQDESTPTGADGTTNEVEPVR